MKPSKQKQIDELNRKIQVLITELNALAGDWRTAHQIAQEKIDQAKDLSALPHFGNDKDDSDFKANNPDELQEMYKYQIPAKYQFEYWMRITSSNVCGYFSTASNIISYDVRLKQLDLYTFIMFAIMFDNFGLYNDGSKIIPVTIDGEYATPFWFNKRETWTINNNKVDNKNINLRVKIDSSVQPLYIFWDGIGYYIRLIPYLTKEIYYEWARDDVVGLLNIIPQQNVILPDTQTTANQVLYNKAEHIVTKHGDRQIRIKTNNTDSEKTWLTPPAEANMLYETLTKNIDWVKMNWRHNFGIPFGNVNSANSNDSFVDGYQAPFLALMKPIYEYFIKIKELWFLRLEVPNLWDTKIEQQKEQHSDDKGDGENESKETDNTEKKE
jgi:hypothetical protein